MIHIVDACYKKGIAIRFLENGLSTEGLMSKMIIPILAAVAEAERILERTNDDRIAAMVSGVRFGRKPHPATTSAMTLIQQGLPFKVVSERTGISRPTYFRIKKRLMSSE